MSAISILNKMSMLQKWTTHKQLSTVKILSKQMHCTADYVIKINTHSFFHRLFHQKSIKSQC